MTEEEKMQTDEWQEQLRQQEYEEEERIQQMIELELRLKRDGWMSQGVVMVERDIVPYGGKKFLAYFAR